MNKFGPLWHPQTNLSTLDRDRLVITGGEGAWLITEDGQRLLDLPASLWHANIGHGRARVAEAAAAQIRDSVAYPSPGWTSTADLLPVAAGQFAGGVDRVGAARGEVDRRLAHRQHGDQPLGELHRRSVRVVAEEVVEPVIGTGGVIPPAEG